MLLKKVRVAIKCQYKPSAGNDRHKHAVGLRIIGLSKTRRNDGTADGTI